MRCVSLCRFVRGLMSLLVLFGFALFINSGLVTQYVREKLSPALCSDLHLRSNSMTTKMSDCNKGPRTVDRQKEEGKVIIFNKKDGKRSFEIAGLPEKPLKEIRENVIMSELSSDEKSAKSKAVKRTYDQRRRRLMQSCGGKRGHTWDEKMQLIAVPDKNLTVCVVQKAGSSSWHHLVYKLREPNGTWSGKRHTENRLHGLDLPPSVKHRLIWDRNATRILTVRHPFARLISGWNNKFHKNHLMHSFSTTIFNHLPGIQDYVGRHKPDDDHVIAFEDFAQYVADYGEDKIDHHFKSIEKHCLPCQFPYEYIVKAETSASDSWWVLDRVNASMGVYAKHTATGSGVQEVEAQPAVTWDAERKVMAAFYKKVPLPTVNKLMEMFALDFERFGYTFDTETMMAGDIVD